MKRIKTPLTQGDPLLTVMQLEELNKKLDDMIDRLERIEQRQKSGLERIEERQKEGLEQLKEAPSLVIGTFGSSELPPPKD